MLEKLKSLYNVGKITVFQRRSNFSLSTLNQRHRFWVDNENNFYSYVLILMEL